MPPRRRRRKPLWRDADASSLGHLLYEVKMLERGWRSSKFSDISTAVRALHAEPIYHWLKKHVPAAVDVRGDVSPFRQFHRVHLVFTCIWFFDQDVRAVKPKLKHRAALIGAFALIREKLMNGELLLPNEDRHDSLLEQIEEVGEILDVGRRHKPSGYPQLETLAHELVRLGGVASVKLLKEVAKACGLDCNSIDRERTLQRCMRQARLDFARGLRARSLLRR
jgi:hypothetical protein